MARWWQGSSGSPEVVLKGVVGDCSTGTKVASANSLA